MMRGTKDLPSAKDNYIESLVAISEGTTTFGYENVNWGHQDHDRVQTRGTATTTETNLSSPVVNGGFLD